MKNIISVTPEFVADISSNIILEVAKSGKIIYRNTKASCVFNNLAPDCGIKDIVPYKSLIVMQHNLETALYQQYPHHFYWEVQNRFYLVYAYPKDKTVWFVLDDITEKRQLAHILHISQQRMFFAERISKLGYWELDINAKKFYWSDEVYNIFGIKDVGQTYHRNLIRDMLHHDDMPVYKQKLKELLHNHNEVEGNIRIITQSGTLKYCRFLAGIIYESGEAKIAGVFQDITSIITTQLELEKAQKIAEELNKEKSYFLAQASHDVRQPLNAIALFAEGLKNAPTSQYPEIANKIIDLSSNLVSMLNNLLDISKLDYQNYPNEKETFDLSILIQRIADESKISASAANKKIIIRTKQTIINQDPLLIERVIRNLLSNALKFAKSKIIIGNNSNSFYVIDDGCGIDSETKSHIFNAFYQGKNNHHKSQGAGLGLYIVNKILTAINAKITIKSSLNKYSIFKVSF